MYKIAAIREIVQGRFQQQAADTEILHLVYDSRKIQFPEASLFFALKTKGSDGHRFMQHAWQSGVRNFIADHDVETEQLPQSNVLVVGDTLLALQQLAAFHRKRFDIPVIGITGSNGKTIVKEWLFQLLQPDYLIVRSPKSYNSQIGVPLSIWQLNSQHTLAIFEAGISQPGEMERLAAMIQPTIGIFTNLGAAHDAGFESLRQKAEEKSRLLAHASAVIFNTEAIGPPLFLKKEKEKWLRPDVTVFDWSAVHDARLVISSKIPMSGGTVITGEYNGSQISITVPFTDEAYIQNAVHCWCVLLHLGYDDETIKERLAKLHAVDMRLQLHHGINHCLLINDTYSADISSLRIALEFQQQQGNLKRTVIISDFLETAGTAESLYSQIMVLLLAHKVEKLVAIGGAITGYLKEHDREHDAVGYHPELHLYADTDAFIKTFKSSDFNHEIILVKGARRFELERVVQLLMQQVHQTVLEINLNAIVHNLKQYIGIIQPRTKIMAMVKAFAYGSGGAEIAGVLQYHNVQYLGVAYPDEGIDLRKAGISLPVMVMNADESSYQMLTEYNLQPVIYSFELLQRFSEYIRTQGLSFYPVHIEVETGMNRLGFSIGDMPALAGKLASGNLLKVESVFTHLAASDDPAQDEFTMQQAAVFHEAATVLEQKLSYSFLKHISNSAAIIRHPQLQLDMVRLGIGLYGVEIASNRLELQSVATLRSTIAQIKHLKAGDTVSYNRNGVIREDAVIATVRIGYADGYSRRFSSGVGKMWVRGQLAPVVGVVCMDMTMINITGIKGVREGDEVIVFGAPLPVQQVAEMAQTIPYEIMTSVSQRVKRVYYQE